MSLSPHHSTAKPDSNLASFGSHYQTDLAGSERRLPATREWSGPPLALYFYLMSVILVVCRHSVVCEKTLSVRITPSSGYFEEMKVAILVCSMSSAPGSDVRDSPLSWSRVGGLPASAIISSSQQNDSGGVVDQSTLNFIPTELDNQVSFVCSGRVGPLTGEASYAPKVILVQQNPVIIAPDRADVSGSYTWTCRSDGASLAAPNVYWRNGLGVLMTNGVRRETTIRTKPNNNAIYVVRATITLTPPTIVGGNSLACTSVHAVGGDVYTSKKITSIDVSLPIVTKTGGDLLYTTQNLTQTISCLMVDSSPAVTNVSWTKDGKPIGLNNGRYMQVNTSSPSLTIVSVQSEDSGDYLCWLFNPVGASSFIPATTLLVKYPPSIVYSENTTTLTETSGVTVTIPCPVDAFPHPTNLLWHRFLADRVQLVNISGEPRYSGGTVQHQQYGLTINELTGSDAGVYLCEAFNIVGAGRGPNITIIVNSPGSPPDAPKLGSTAAVAFAAVSLVLLVLIIAVVIAFCCHGKCVRRQDRAKVSPLVAPSVVIQPEGVNLPPFDQEENAIQCEMDDRPVSPDPVVWAPSIERLEIINSVPDVSVASVARALRLPPLEHETKSTGPSLSSVPEMAMASVARALRLSPLEQETKSPDVSFTWSAHLQKSLASTNGQALKVGPNPVISSMDQKQHLAIPCWAYELEDD